MGKRWLFLLLAVLPLGAVAAPMGFDEARHLLNRTSFAAGLSDIESYARLTRVQAVDQLLGLTGASPVTPPPSWVGEYESPAKMRDASEEERKLFQRQQFVKGGELRAWWLTEMLVTPSPLTEKMVLFWHNHFVSSLQKVRSPVLMYRQNQLLRKYALGYFGDLLHAVAKDPAMVVYLDSASNRKGRPNENFAREVMELFTLGEGRYSEQDVKEAARAFTGWSIDQERGEFVFRQPAHDAGVKNILGSSGNFDGDAVLDLLLAQPQTAEFVVRKLWREFVSPQPDAAEVTRIARLFRDNRYNIRVALRALLTADVFYAPQNRAALLKSPVDLIVGSLRQFRFETGEVTPFVNASRQLGQDLFAPPNVKGWPGGEAWINSATLLRRKQLLERLFRAQEMRPAVAPVRAEMDIYFDSERWLQPFADADARLIKVVLATDPASSVVSTAHGLPRIRELVLDPAYQLK